MTPVVARPSRPARSPDRPIKFVGVGEGLDDLDVFHPDRMASRILGMGDVLTLIEKAEEAFDEEEAMKAAEKMRQASVRPRGLPRAVPAAPQDGTAAVAG